MTDSYSPDSSEDSRMEPYYGLLREKTGYLRELVSSKKRTVKYRFRRARNRFRKEWNDGWDERYEWLAYSLAPFVAGYGLAISFVLSEVLGTPLTASTVLAYGLLWYFIKVEAVEIWNELAPFIGVRARVNNK